MNVRVNVRVKVRVIICNKNQGATVGRKRTREKPIGRERVPFIEQKEQTG